VFDFSCNSDVNWLACEFGWNNSPVTFPIFPIGAAGFVDIIDGPWTHSDDMVPYLVNVFIKEWSRDLETKVFLRMDRGIDGLNFVSGHSVVQLHRRRPLSSNICDLLQLPK
jgi:hypothetical protein